LRGVYKLYSNGHVYLKEIEGSYTVRRMPACKKLINSGELGKKDSLHKNEIIWTD
jgi:hypothetical protein